ncbi:putative mannan endo-1,4-beta-mannosidase [Planoprotostelium fungivorum]|uniref:Putative mannan endo-1,4-beta-mannosidase n=1 Tax=Planoprotostelium fungivorum TaxID=1890364 RepID=A0A2P6N2E2_9EUKA|nr:putative mannan endo-1,4-beta-mannosidase [Planoprotostelium fungivorum]
MFLVSFPSGFEEYAIHRVFWSNEFIMIEFQSPLYPAQQNSSSTTTMNIASLVHHDEGLASPPTAMIGTHWVRTKHFVEPMKKDTDRRRRTQTPASQKEILENIFKDVQYPNAQLRQQMANTFNTTSRKIQIWFQNRRTRYDTSEGMCEKDKRDAERDQAAHFFNGVKFTGSINSSPKESNTTRFVSVWNGLHRLSFVGYENKEETSVLIEDSDGGGEKEQYFLGLDTRRTEANMVAQSPRFLLFLYLLGSVSAGTDYICNNVAWGSVTLPVYDSNTISSTVSLDTAIGRSSQIVQYYVNWADGYLGDNAAAPDFSKWGDFPKWINAAKSFSSVGLSQHVPLITWQPWGSPYTNANTKYSYSTISAGTWDSYVDSFGRRTQMEEERRSNISLAWTPGEVGSRTEANMVAQSPRFLLFLYLLGSVSAGTDYICNNVAWGSVTLPVYDSNTISSTVSLDTAIGRSSQIVQYYVNWADGYLGDNAAAPDFSKWGDFPKWINAAKSFSSVGLSQHVPLITWQPWGSPYTNANTKYSYSTISAGTWDSYVDSFGRVMNSFNSTIYIRFAHEFDGDWYPWGAGAGFIAAWRRVYTRVMAVAPKVQFVWCPNNSNGKGVKFEDYYPGDQYVHWMCLDAYADSTTYAFADTITKNAVPAQPYQRLTALSAKKPIMIAEFGVNNMGENRHEERKRLMKMTVQGSISQGQWYQNMADSLASSFPQIKAVVHFDVAHSDKSWKIDTSNSGLTSQIKTAWGCNGGISSLTSWGVNGIGSTTKAASTTSSSDKSTTKSSTNSGTKSSSTNSGVKSTTKQEAENKTEDGSFIIINGTTLLTEDGQLGRGAGVPLSICITLSAFALLSLSL